MSKSKGSSWAAGRHQARALAMQMLFEADFGGAPVEQIPPRRLSEPPGDPEAPEPVEQPVPREVAEYAETLFREVWERRQEYDLLIAQLAPTWPIRQMARVDRNILRIALHEMMHVPEVPTRAAINEAVELAKEYGSEASRRFINGVLGTVAAEFVRSGEASAAPGEAPAPPVPTEGERTGDEPPIEGGGDGGAQGAPV